MAKIHWEQSENGCKNCKYYGNIGMCTKWYIPTSSDELICQEFKEKGKLL